LLNSVFLSFSISLVY